MDCTTHTDDEASEEINTETGEIRSRQRKAPLESLVPEGRAGGKIPKMPGENSQRRVVFISLSPLGAHVMVTAKLTGRQYQIVFLLIRDMDYSGRNYTHPDFIAGELGMDSSDVRKALKVLEEKNVLIKLIMKNKGHCYWFNPKFITAQSSDEVEKLYTAWVIEKARKNR